MTRYLCALLLSASLGLLACDSTESKVSAFCDSNCAKQAECNLLGPFSQSQCKTACKEAGSGASSQCEPSSSAVDACVAAINSATCAELTSSFPAACDFDCPDNNPDASGDTFTPADTSAGTATCSDLADCCPQLPSDQQDGCNQLVATGNDFGCSASLNAFKGTGLCN